jgi:hypothetical protein
MVTITASTVRATIFETLYDSLTASLSAGTVTAAFIDDNPTFPQVVINPAKVTEKKLSFNRAAKEYTFEVEIDLFTKKNKEVDQISDEIQADLNTNESTLNGFGLILNDLEDSTTDTFFWNDQKIHHKAVVLIGQVKI